MVYSLAFPKIIKNTSRSLTCLFRRYKKNTEVNFLGLKMTPELKSPRVEMPFGGDYTQTKYAQQMIEEYKTAGFDPSRAFAQSFNLDDLKYWLKNGTDSGFVFRGEECKKPLIR